MTQGGFYDRKTASPAGLTIVIAAHAAALTALALMKGPVFVRQHFPPTITRFIPLPEDPPENPPPPKQVERQLPLPPVMDRVPPVIETPVDRPVIVDNRPTEPPVFVERRLPEIPAARPNPAPSEPVRVAAQVDPRFAGALQPPYPTSELRAEREGTVRVRVTIGADGRVKAIEKISATSDAFWEATQRHALARWRFRPATLDGRPVESTKTMNVLFEMRT
ncbi:MAG TPA: energy transducer TonB [Allosphingosinicella sp.]